MEVDWEVEVGGGAPVINANWPGLVDLRRHPERAWQLLEAAELPALAEALAKLNAEASPVWTSKCDVWPVVDFAEFDPDELDAFDELGAPLECAAAHAIGCYIDVLPKSGQRWSLPARAVAECKHLCSLLRAVPLRCCRLDLLIRRAVIDPNLKDQARMDLGVTAYLTACGPSPVAAKQTLQAALAAFARVLGGQSTLEWESTGE